MATGPLSASGTIDSPLDVAEATFRLLSCAPDGLALDCTGLHRDLPADRSFSSSFARTPVQPDRLPTGMDGIWKSLVERAREDHRDGRQSRPWHAR